MECGEMEWENLDCFLGLRQAGGPWVLLTKLEPGEVEVPCDMLGAVAHMTDPSWDSGVFS